MVGAARVNCPLRRGSLRHDVPRILSPHRPQRRRQVAVSGSWEAFLGAGIDEASEKLGVVALDEHPALPIGGRVVGETVCCVRNRRYALGGVAARGATSLVTARVTARVSHQALFHIRRPGLSLLHAAAIVIREARIADGSRRKNGSKERKVAA